MDLVIERLEALLTQPAVLGFVQMFALVLARILPVTTFSPIFGGQDTPPQFRMGLAALLAALIAPGVPRVGIPADSGVFVGLFVKELLLGGIIAIVLVLVFELFAASGILVDVLRGSTMAESQDPATGQRLSSLGVFFKLLFVTVFVAGGGHRLLIQALGEGLVRLPPGSVLGDAEGARLVGREAAANLATLVGELVLVSLRIAVPVAALVVIVDASLGLLGRVAAQIQAFFLGLTIKGTLGIAVTLLVIGIGVEQFLEIVPELVLRTVGLR